MEVKLAIAHELAQEMCNTAQGDAVKQSAILFMYADRVKVSCDLVDESKQPAIKLIVFTDNSGLLASYHVGQVTVIEPCPDSALRDVRTYLEYLQDDPKLKSRIEILMQKLTPIGH